MTLEAQATSLRQELAKEAYTINYTLAKNPEISSQEFKSAALICDVLETHGMTVTRELADLPTAFKAEVVRSSKPQGRLAILCEYDALPEIGHACGHCASGSSSVLAALTLHALATQLADSGDDLGVDADIIGTPDEEAAGGKVDLVKAGVFDGYDFAMMVHMAGVETRANADFLALDDYRVAFYGKPAHAAGEPWNGINGVERGAVSVTSIGYAPSASATGNAHRLLHCKRRQCFQYYSRLRRNRSMRAPYGTGVSRYGGGPCYEMLGRGSTGNRDYAHGNAVWTEIR